MVREHRPLKHHQEADRRVTQIDLRQQPPPPPPLQAGENKAEGGGQEATDVGKAALEGPLLLLLRHVEKEAAGKRKESEEGWEVRERRSGGAIRRVTARRAALKTRNI